MGLGLTGVAFVTGAGGALGRAIVLQFARDGVTRIAGLDISERGLAETAAVLQSEVPGVEFLSSTADISNEEQIQVAFKRIVDKFGRIDYAVNNAAIASPFVTTGNAELKDFERVQNVNIKGTWLCQREELRQMVKQDPLVPEGGAASGRVASKGSVVIVSSLLGHRAMPLDGLYTISKHAILGMAKTDALDYATRGIRINAVCPGFIDTPVMTPSARELLKPQVDKTPMARLAYAQEVADAVVYLASDRSSYITGNVLAVDGGYSAQ